MNMQHVAPSLPDSGTWQVVGVVGVVVVCLVVWLGWVGSVCVAGWVGFWVGFWSFRDRASTFVTLSGGFCVQNSPLVVVCRIVALGVALGSFLRLVCGP